LHPLIEMLNQRINELMSETPHPNPSPQGEGRRACTAKAVGEATDNYVQAPGFTQSYNRYSYCMNNPLKYTDPSGNEFVSYSFSNVSFDQMYPQYSFSSFEGLISGYDNLLQAMFPGLSELGVQDQSALYDNTSTGQYEHGYWEKQDGGSTPGGWDPEIGAMTLGTAIIRPDKWVANNGGAMGGDGDNWLSNAGTALGMTMMWATGARLPFGAGSHYENDAVANAFRNAPGIVQARKDYYATGKTSGPVSFGLSGYWNAKNDPIESFVGSYDYQISVIENNLQFTIINRTSISSFIPHPQDFYIWPQSWIPSSGSFSSFDQTYIFTEPIRK
jgi:hypothetical protein